MKCTSKTEYDCFYLNKNNIKEFVEWLKNFNNVLFATFDNDYLKVCFRFVDNIADVLMLEYNRWYIFKDGNLYDYSPEFFMKCYNVII